MKIVFHFDNEQLSMIFTREREKDLISIIERSQLSYKDAFTHIISYGELSLSDLAKERS